MAQAVPPFDTQQEAVRLRDAGLDPRSADAVVETVRRAVANLVTREDLDEAVAGLKAGVEADINRQTAALKEEIRKDIRQVEAKVDQALAVIHETRTGILGTETDIHRAIADIHKAVNAQTWRYVVFTGALLGLLRWLFPATP